MSDITLDDLKHFWMPSGVPCFIADRQDICDVVEAMGFQIYYLISNEAKEVKPAATNNTQNRTAGAVSTTSAATNYYSSQYGNYGGYNTTNKYGTNLYNTPPQPKIERKPQLFKVVKNYVGRAVSISKDEFPSEFIDVEEECSYTMPLIPRQIIDKLDEFFRLIYSQHGTESIVILTYDTTKEGPEGWGVLVPEQTNTAAHCKYDADSIAAIKPDNVMIVGSVHSHPEMSAYASGTDHEDQADFDGIHITYGWQKTVQNGATQYHIELQMSGNNYRLDIEDVFESYQLGKEPDPEVVEWSGKVKKAYPPLQGASSVQQSSATRQQNNPNSLTLLSEESTKTGKAAGDYKTKLSFKTRLFENINYIQLIEEMHLPTNSLVVVEISLDDEGKGHCPCCECPIDSTNIRFGRCDICDIPFVDEQDQMGTISEKAEDYIWNCDLPLTISTYLFAKDDQGNPIIIKLDPAVNYYAIDKDPRDKQSLVDQFKDDFDYVHIPTDDSYSIYDHDDTFTVCCGVKVVDMQTDCYCPVPIFHSDLTDFDELLKDGNIYASDSDCNSCAYYYEPKCPAYRELLTQYTRNRNAFNLNTYVKSISGCSNYIHYKEMPVSIGKA